MKKIIILNLFLLISLFSHSQNIENPSFDSAYIGGIDRIFEWITSDSWNVNPGDTVYPLTPMNHYISVGLQYHETLYSTQLEYSGAFHGSLAIKVLCETGRVDILGNPFRGFVLNGNHFYTDTNGYLDLNKCGTPFPYRPYKLRGHYKLVDNSPSLHNYPEAIILLKKYNSSLQTIDTIGYAVADLILFPTPIWREFEMPINYFSSQVPDSIVVAFYSPSLGHNSTLWVDSLGFDYNFPAGIEENKNDDNPFVYFNRGINKICISDVKNVQAINIFTVTGKLIFHTDSPSEILDFDLSENGVYLTTLEEKNKSVRAFKIIK